MTSVVTSDVIKHNLNVCLHFTKSLLTLYLKIPPSSYIPVLTCFFFVTRSIDESDKIAKKINFTNLARKLFPQTLSKEAFDMLFYIK